MYYINNEESSSKTNLPQTWGKPSKAGEEKYKKGKQISELFQPKKPRLEVIPIDKNYFVENSNILSLSCPLSYNLKGYNKLRNKFGESSYSQPYLNNKSN